MSASDWNWPGARWWRCDLHVHTPASHDFSNRETTTWVDFVAAVRASDVDVIAVTDHNTASGVDEVRDSAFVVFPGIELTVSPGVHLLALFDPSMGRDAVVALLGRCGIPASKFADPDVCSSMSVVDAMNEIVAAGALCIGAHADDTCGILQEVGSGQALVQIVTSPNLSAIEVKNGDPDLLKYVDGSIPEYRRPAGPLPLIASSDAHTLPEIGISSTWIKMTRPTHEGLRLALQDGPLSVRDPHADGNPNQHASLAVESIEITDARYIGRGEIFNLRLNPWLNTIIGGRGTGKSSVVELLRAALRREEELPGPIRRDWNEMVRVAGGRGTRGILTANTRVTVVYRKDGARFRIQWDPAGATPPIEVQQPDGTWTPSPGEVADRFPVRIYSQKQVYELTREPEALLRIVDEAPEVGHQAWLDGWNTEEARFLSLRAQAREVESSLTDEPRVRGELEDVRRRLSVFEAAGHAELLKLWQRRRRQQRSIENWAEGLGTTADRIEELVAAAELDPIDASVFDPTDSADVALLDAIAATVVQAEKIREDASSLAARADSLRAGWPDILARSPWSAALKDASVAYEQLIQALEAAGGGDPSEYGRLVQQRQLLEGRLGAFAGKRETLSSLRSQAEESLDRLRALRRELSERRMEFLTNVLAGNPFVLIEVVPMGALGSVTPELRRLIGREDGTFQKDIGDPDDPGTLVGDFAGNYCRDFERADEDRREAIVDDHLAHLDALKRRLWDVRTGTQPAADRRFAQHMASRPPEQMDRLDAWFPSDTLLVSFQGAGKRKGFQPITQGSPGQRSAALLAFLLSHGQEPIVLDQPEDDLDNQLVYDLIVQQLRQIKGRRQVLVVTHNANIVVNGDAELVVALDVRGGRTLQVCVGGLQEQNVRDEICRVMEGGAVAFRERYRRIAQGGSDV